MSGFAFTRLTPNDMPLMLTWLEKPHVKRWFGDPVEWQEEIEANWNSDWIWHYRVDHGGKPFGFAQCYWTDQAPAGEWSAMPPGTLGLDYFIADEENMGKGHGRAMLEAFIDHVVGIHAPERLIADPEPENDASIRMLEKLGFAFDAERALMVRSAAGN